MSVASFSGVVRPLTTGQPEQIRRSLAELPKTPGVQDSRHLNKTRLAPSSRSFFVVPFRLELPTSTMCTLKPSFQDWFSSLILPAHLAIALNMAMMIPTPRIEPIDVEASRIGNNGPYAARRMDLANASMGQLGTDDGDQD